MSPDRKIVIGGKLVEEYYWAGKMVVYIDHYATEETYEEAVARLGNEELARAAKAGEVGNG